MLLMLLMLLLLLLLLLLKMMMMVLLIDGTILNRQSKDYSCSIYSHMIVYKMYEFVSFQ